MKTRMHLVAFYFWANWAVLGRAENSAISLKYSTFEGGVLINVNVRKLEIFALKCTSKSTKARTINCECQSISILFIQLGIYDFA